MFACFIIHLIMLPLNQVNLILKIYIYIYIMKISAYCKYINTQKNMIHIQALRNSLINIPIHRQIHLAHAQRTRS